MKNTDGGNVLNVKILARIPRGFAVQYATMNTLSPCQISMTMDIE